MFLLREIVDESMINDTVVNVRTVLERLYDWFTAAYLYSNVTDYLDYNFNTLESMNLSGKVLQNAWSVGVKNRKIKRLCVRSKNEIDWYLDQDVEEGEDNFYLMCWCKLMLTGIASYLSLLEIY